MIVITGNRESDIKSIASVLNEIGVGGLNRWLEYRSGH